MADVLGRGTIELVGDARKLRASVETAKKSIRGLGRAQKDTTAAANRSIDKYILRLKAQNAVVGKSRREQELYKLALRGASNAQLAAANSALIMAERQQRAAATVQKLKIGLIALAAAGAVFGRFIQSTIDAQDALSKLSEKVGIGVEDLAGLQHAGELAGLSQEQLTKGLKSLAVQLFDANSGLLESQRNFRSLGIEFKDAEGNIAPLLPTFLKMADRFREMDDSGTKSALAVKLLGKAGLDAIPFLNQGSAAIEELVKQGQALNPVTAESAKQSEIFNDSMSVLLQTFQALIIAGVNDLLPFLSQTADLFSKEALAGNAEDSAKALKETEGEINKVALAFKAMLVIGSNVSFFFERVGTLIGAAGAQIASFISGDFAAIRAIHDAAKADLDKSFQEQVKRQAQLIDLGKKIPVGLGGGVAPDIPGGGGKGGKVKPVDSEAEAAAKAAAGKINAFTASLDLQVASLGKSKTEIELYKAALLGMEGAELKATRTKLESIEAFKKEEGFQKILQQVTMKSAAEYVAFAEEIKKVGEASQANIDRLEFELTLVDKTDQERMASLATYDAEIRAKERLLKLAGLTEGAEGDAIKKSIEASKQREIRAAEISAQIEQNQADLAEFDQFGIQAARNLQTHFADFFFDPFDKGVKGMLLGFLDVTRRMVAEVASKAVLGAIFGGSLGGGGSGGGLLGGLLGSIGGFFGFADGGDHRGGLRLVGEKGPELEATGPSRIFSSEKTREIMGGGGGVTIVQRNNFALGVSQTVRHEIDQAMPAITQKAIQAVVNAKGRGGPLGNNL